MPDASLTNATVPAPIATIEERAGGAVYMGESVSAEARRRPVARAWRAWCSAVHGGFGIVSLVVLLSVLATIPILQFMSLGYLLEASARVARTGKLRHGFVGVRKAAQMGSVCLGAFMIMLPLRFVSSLAYSSYLLNGESSETRNVRLVLWGIAMLTLWHLGWAVYRGGKMRHFCWPAPWRFVQAMRQGGMYEKAANQLHAYCVSLRLPYYFWLGLRGFVGASLWLFVPVTLMAISSRADDVGFGGLLAFLGGFLLAIVLLYLPFLQARFAMTGRFRCQFEVRRIRQLFTRAPLAYACGLLLTLTLAIPLYLLKAELIPREAVWLPSLFFVLFMFPARLAVGWALARATRREQPRLWVSRWFARLTALPATLLYALIVYFTQFTSWHGSWSLYEQHAFLVPVPFLGF